MATTHAKTLSVTHGEFDQVKFTDSDNHIFFMKMGKAFEACRRDREWEAEMEHDEVEFCIIVDEWLKQNRDRFARVAVMSSVKGLHLYFSSKGDAFDVALSEKLAELESEALSRLSALRLITRQVSAAEFGELQEIEKSRRNAEHSSAHQPVET